MSLTYLVISFALVFLSSHHVRGQCTDGRDLTFAKIAGFSPILPNATTLIYSSSYGAAITAECYNRCRSSVDCIGFILDYTKSSCYKVPDIPGIYRDKVEPNPAVNYFFKLCLNLPGDCPQRAWSLETTPGYELVGVSSTVLPNISDRWHCAQLCINNFENGACLSVNYHPSSQACALNFRSRWTDPESFIPTVHKDSFYIENHCADSEEEKCWHDPIYNQTSMRSDLQFNNLTQTECQDKCGNETYFRCRGFSYLEESGLRPSQCLLHSDTANFSPLLNPSLVETQNALYVEAIKCVNLSVSCDEKVMSVMLNSDKFEGMIYTQGHSDSCYIQGRGEAVTVLKIGLESSQAVRCGAKIAYAIGPVNRTMVSAVVVVQRHQLIQTASDSVVRVSCILPSKGAQDNLTLTTGFSVLEPGVQTEVTSVGTEGEVTKPAARITVTDPRTGKVPKQIQLGDPIVLKIEVNPPYNSSMVRAGHLIASSGTHTESLLLLDARGCPPSVSLFPPLISTDPQTLQAEFRAFRFPSSPVLALSLVLTFCPTVCKPVDCGNGVISSGKRRKRSIESGYREIPLQLVLVIHSDESEANSSNILQASLGGNFEQSEENSRQICTSFLTAAIIGLFWVLLQCCILAACCMVVHRRQKDYADTISLRHDFQPRHVTWSDETDSVPTKGLRLTTPMRT